MNQPTKLRQILSAFDPGDDDWIVTYLYPDGTVHNRRLSPGKVVKTSERARQLADIAERRAMKGMEPTRVTIRRAGEAVSVVTDGSEDELTKILREMRCS